MDRALQPNPGARWLEVMRKARAALGAIDICVNDYSRVACRNALAAIDELGVGE